MVRDTVILETPARSATSAMVGWRWRIKPGGGGGLGMGFSSKWRIPITDRKGGCKLLRCKRQLDPVPQGKVPGRRLLTIRTVAETLVHRASGVDRKSTR